MKINWGTGIAIFYISFMIIMISMVVKSVRNNVDLVDKEYYVKDINYEKFRKKRANGTSLQEQLNVVTNVTNKTLLLSFPKDMKGLKGETFLFRPSNSQLDVHLPLVLDENNKMKISTTRFKGGLWRLKTEWTYQGITYYAEQKITL